MTQPDKEAPIHKKSFNFGIRKPMECVVDKKTTQELKDSKRGRLNKNIYHDDIWMNYLLGKWVYTFDRTYAHNVYYKHVLKDKRIYQVIYSGLDILGDGLYLLYKADIYTQVQNGNNNRKAFYIMPTQYDILKGSFECEDFVADMMKDGWMTKEEYDFVKKHCAQKDCEFAISNVWEKGGEGGKDLALKVLDIMENSNNEFQFLYTEALPLEEKIKTIAREMYGADGVEFEGDSAKNLKQITKMGFGHLPVCMAKTQYSLSDDASKLGRPSGFKIHVRDVYVSAGAGFVVVLTGKILTMPGLPSVPAAQNIDYDGKTGKISGLF